ncbi:MAG: 1-phosphofructokinase family hexose kinase [Acidimicrobiales bacterium]
MPDPVLAVSLNPALDVTYRVAALRPGGVHRVAHHVAVPGGKAVNVARTLAALGHPVTLTGLLGGPTGQALGAGLETAAIETRFVEIEAETRRTVVVVDEAGAATGFWEAGPLVAIEEWLRLLDVAARLVRSHPVVALSGSLPPGVPVDAYAELVGLARRAGAAVILDADGEPLRHALAARPDIVKPNRDELLHVAGDGGEDPLGGAGPASLLAAAERMREAGAASVVASLGDDGLFAVTPSGRFRAMPPEVVVGNPTGAGDAVVAALARGLAAGDAWSAVLADAVALAAATVASPTAGDFSLDHYRRWRAKANAEEMPS